MFEIHVTVHCPDLVTAAQLLAKCSGTPAPAAPANTEAIRAQMQQPTANPTVSGGPAILSTPSTLQSSPSDPAALTVPLASAPSFSLADISKAGADLIGANPALLPKVNELLAQFGIQTLDKLKPDQFGAFATALRGLGAKI